MLSGWEMGTQQVRELMEKMVSLGVGSGKASWKGHI